MEDMVADSAGRLFADWKERSISVLPPEAERGEIPLLTRLWTQVEDQGFPLALLSEADGGFGVDPESALMLPRLAAEYGLALPLGETMIARLLAVRGGFVLPQDGIVTFGEVSTDASGVAPRLPWGRYAAAAIVVREGTSGPVMAVVDPSAHDLVKGRNILCEPRDSLRLGPGIDWRPAPVSPIELHALGAILRAVEIAGACRTVLAMCLDYAGQRQQFGKPLSRFQVIQHNLAMMASQAAATGAAASGAARALSAWVDGSCPSEALVLHAAAAKIRAGEAAGLIASQAQQLHGAIGITREFPLHAWTRRLWSWRDEFGSEAQWADHLGAAALSAPALWPFLTDLGEVIA